MERKQQEVKVSAKIIKAVSNAKTEEELLALVKAEGLDCSEEMVKAYFAQNNKTGELADDELDNVVGGGCGSSTPPYVCEDWHPEIDGDPYNRDNNPCYRCRNSGAAVWRSYRRALERDENVGAPTHIPDSASYCIRDD